MKKSLALLFCLIYTSYPILAWQYFSQNYTSKDYAAHPLVWKFVQDAKGRLWMANNDGALRFDGGNWKLYPTPKPVRSMIFDKKGNLFLACEGDLGIIKFSSDAKSSYVSFKDKMGDAKALTKGDKNVFLVETDIYFTSEKSIFKIEENDNNYSVKVIQTNAINGAFTHQDKLYINDALKGLSILKGNSLEPINGSTKLKNKLIIGTAILNNELVIATNYDGLYKIVGADIIPLPSHMNEFALKGLGCISVSKNGKIALGTFNDGIKVFDWKGKEEMGIKTPSNEIYSTYFDNEDNLWSAHRKGITHININSNIKEFKDIDLNGTITDVLFHNDKLFVCSSLGLYMMNDESQLMPIKGIGGECWQMIQTENGVLIASTNGLYAYKNGIVKNIIPNQTFIHLQKGNLSGKIYAFAQDAVYIIDDKNETFSIAKLDGINELANSCYEEQDGSLWLGTYYNGLKKVKNAKELSIEIPEALKDGKTTLKRYENKLLVLAKEKVFVLNAKQFESDERLTSLFENTTNKNFEFKSSDIVITPNSIRTYSNGKLNETSILYSIDGKPISVDIDKGLICLANEDKIYKIVEMNISKSKPIVSINAIKGSSGIYIYDNQNEIETSVPKIDPSENHFTIEFGVNSFINSHKNAYRYKINELKNSWSDWQNTSSIDLTGLPSGQYTFELQAKNAVGEISEICTFSFELLCPWYLTRYAIMLYISLGLLSVLMIIKINSKILLAKNKKLEKIVEERTHELSEKNVALTDEKKKSDALLLNILPAEVAEELKSNGYAKARQFEHVTLIFTDFVNFTGISENLSPQQLVEELDYCFKGFDEIIERNQLEKIKTIGDAYLAACGMPLKDPQHAFKVVKAAQQILLFVQKRKANGGLFDIRIGIHSGPIIAGIVGNKKYAYDIWGDTVNTAARMEQNSEAHKINISESTYKQVKSSFSFIHRGKISAKNKGEMDMYYLDM